MIKVENMMRLLSLLLLLALILPSTATAGKGGILYDKLELIKESELKSRLYADSLFNDIIEMNRNPQFATPLLLKKNLNRLKLCLKECILAEQYASDFSNEADAIGCEEANIEGYNTELQFFELKGELKKIYRALDRAYTDRTNRSIYISRADKLIELSRMILFTAGEFLSYAIEAAHECL